MIMKICTKCKKELPATTEFFFADRRGKHGFRSICKICDSLKRKIYYTKNRDKEKIRNHKYYIKNKDAILKQVKKHSFENKSQRSNYLRRIRATNPKQRLSINIGNGIRKSIKRGSKQSRWEGLAGRTLNDLKQSLEKRFTKNMTWDKFLKGEIHIDHIIPQSVFNFTKPEHEDFKRCWSLKNLQPMWAKDNISKGARLTKPFQPSLLM